MKIRFLYLLLILLLPFTSASTAANEGAEIISYQTFGEGVMVTKAKMAPISGTVSNIFFYNRVDEPWNGNKWYEYDFELRGAHPKSAWSQIRVRENDGGQLRDAPVNISMSENIGEKFFHYVLVRKDNQYIYDVRETFDITTYDFTNAEAHKGNSASVVVGGPRVYMTGGRVANIPMVEELDFSLGITAFDNNWAGRLPNNAYHGDYVVDFARFYEFSGDTLNTFPQWQDEFNNNYLDTSKWFAASWTFAKTQFTPDNVAFENGYMILSVNRGDIASSISTTNIALNGTATQSTTAYGGLATRAIDDNRNGVYSRGSVTHTENKSNSWWQVEFDEQSQIDQVVVYNRTNNCCIARLTDFSVSVLDDNDNVVWTKFYSAYPSPSLTIDVNTLGKKLRINRNGVLSLAEVNVYGASAP